MLHSTRSSAGRVSRSPSTSDSESPVRRPPVAIALQRGLTSWTFDDDSDEEYDGDPDDMSPEDEWRQTKRITKLCILCSVCMALVVGAIMTITDGILTHEGSTIDARQHNGHGSFKPLGHHSLRQQCTAHMPAQLPGCKELPIRASQPFTTSEHGFRHILLCGHAAGQEAKWSEWSKWSECSIECGPSTICIYQLQKDHFIPRSDVRRFLVAIIDHLFRKRGPVVASDNWDETRP